MWIVDALLFFLPGVPAFFVANALMQRLGQPPSAAFKQSFAGTFALFAVGSVPAMFFNDPKLSALDDLVMTGFLATIGYDIWKNSDSLKSGGRWLFALIIAALVVVPLLAAELALISNLSPSAYTIVVSLVRLFTVAAVCRLWMARFKLSDGAQGRIIGFGVYNAVVVLSFLLFAFVFPIIFSMSLEF